MDNLNTYFGGLLGSLNFWDQSGPHWPEANALTTTLWWRLTSGKCGEQAPSQGSPPKHRGYERGALSGLLVSEMLKRSVEEEIVASCSED